MSGTQGDWGHGVFDTTEEAKAHRESALAKIRSRLDTEERKRQPLLQSTIDALRAKLREVPCNLPAVRGHDYGRQIDAPLTARINDVPYVRRVADIWQQSLPHGDFTFTAVPPGSHGMRTLAIYRRADGSVTFDWPAIEACAANPEAPGHDMACMLLAARTFDAPENRGFGA